MPSDNHMETLYRELWGKKTVGLKKFRIPVPQIPSGLEPGYGSTIETAAVRGFDCSSFPLPVEEEEFTVLETCAVLPCGHRKLLVREEYDNIERVLRDVESEKWSEGTDSPQQGSSLDYIVEGQPGCGKSIFLSYLLARRLLKGQPTVYRESDELYFLFASDSPGAQVDPSTLFDLSQDRQRELWVLTEKALTHGGWNRHWNHWFLVLVASTDTVRASYEWEGERNAGAHYIAHSKWGEIFATYSLRKETPPTPAQIWRLYATFVCLGPIPRTCLQSIPPTTQEAYNAGIKTYLTGLDMEVETFLRLGSYRYERSGANQPLSRKITIMEPTENGWSYNNRIATRWITHRVLKAALKQSAKMSFRFYKWFSCSSVLQFAACWTFEGYAQIWVNQGGRFIAERLPVSDRHSAPLEFRTVKNKEGLVSSFISADDLARQVKVADGGRIAPHAIGKYFLPAHQRPQSVAGLVITRVDTMIVLRITQSHSLTIDQDEITDLLRSLPPTIKKIHVVFVVPEDGIQHRFRCTSIQDTSAISQEVANLTVRQFRLVFSDKKMQAVTVYEQLDSEDDD